MQLLTNPRNSSSIDGTWQMIPDQYEQFDGYFDNDDGHLEDLDMPDIEMMHSSIYEPSASTDVDLIDYNIYDGYPVPVPSSLGDTVPEFRHFEGWVWYAKEFDRSVVEDGDRTFLRFGAVNYKTKVWLNGEELGAHEGGFTPFSFEITDALEDGENVLVVQVDSKRYDDGMPEEMTDFYNFGGINRSVELVTTPEEFIKNFKVETTISDETVDIDISAWVDAGDTSEPVTVEIPEIGVETELNHESGSEFAGSITVPKSDISLWSPSNPRLYTVQLSHRGDTLDDSVGFREVEVRDGDILLNGEPIWLRGIALHEEVGGRGRALDSNDIRTRFQWLNELGCNYARLAHYPHTEEMARMADKEGILLWEEVPAYHNINFGDEDVQELYRQQLREVVQRDWNRASVALWSIANETDHTDETRNKVLPQMANYVRELDDTRLVTAACFISDTDDGLIIRDPLKEHLDVIGINQYYGWYYGDADDMQRFQDDPDGTPVVISETGGGAKWGNHGDTDERWTEEFQADIYRGQTETVADIEQISGMSPWILFDFRAPGRQNEYQRGFNRKGVVDQHGRKKKAFHVLREFYQLENLQ